MRCRRGRASSWISRKHFGCWLFRASIDCEGILAVQDLEWDGVAGEIQHRPGLDHDVVSAGKGCIHLNQHGVAGYEHHVRLRHLRCRCACADLEQAEKEGTNLRDAACRVFSNASGSYSSNVNLAVENSTWEEEGELQEMYLSRKTFAFNADNPGEMNQNRDVFESVMKTADVTFQNLDSAEISLTDVSHYFDSDPTKLIAGLRDDGKAPTSYIADTTTANAQVRSLSETIRLDSRTKLLNPKWYEGMLDSGYEGVREVAKRLNFTLGWSATSGSVDNFVYEEANETFINDPEMRKRLLELNPNSFRQIVGTLLEVNGRGYWETSDENIEQLQELYQEVEDRIEGVVAD